VSGLFVLSGVYADRKMFDEAIAVDQKLAAVSPDWKFSLAGSYAMAGRKNEALKLVADMEREGVRFCYTDFFMATRVNFLSRERIVCSAKLGPITTEYFFEYRDRVERAPEAAFIAVNRTSAGRLERRLQELGVGYERLELMKPVLLRLTRKVDPEELYPGREFPLR